MRSRNLERNCKQPKKQEWTALPPAQSLLGITKTPPIELKPSEREQYVSARQAAKMLNVSTSRVYALGRSGAMARLLVLTPSLPRVQRDEEKPHPWLRAEQRRLAQLSGWTHVPKIAARTRRPVKKKAVPVRPQATVWRFHRDEVLAFKEKREADRKRQLSIRERVRRYGASARPIRLSAVRRLRKQWKRRGACKSRKLMQTTEFTSVSALLNWAVPSSL
ncbi:hypothetical protein GCM10011488_26690 [Steroidobacter agaridevorans]|nr:hypothetical protein GCM10011488_26690 [Steroidobacter agaridevorans]